MSGMTGVQLAGSVEGQWQHLPVIRATDLRSLVAVRKRLCGATSSRPREAEEALLAKRACPSRHREHEPHGQSGEEGGCFVSTALWCREDISADGENVGYCVA
jgi:hypothetical protein